MCGIIGKAGTNNVFPQLLKGLENLEYRGYDSAGVAGIADGEICRYRKEGRIFNLRKDVEKDNPESSIGIGHTRWATHGSPTEENAHPHIDESGKFALVHNGIIENAEELKNTFLRGVDFGSETDTEVAVQLIGKFYKDNVISALSEACKEFTGSFAFGIICRDFPGTLFAVGKNSPLVAVKGETGCYIASDLCAVEEEPKEIYRLSDGEICALTKSGMTFYNPSGELIEKFPEKTDYDSSRLEKGDFEHYMLKEIYEQPKAVEDTVTSFIKDGRICFPRVSIGEDFIKNTLEKIVIVACGSAYHAGLCGKNVIEKFCKIPCCVEVASEFRYSEPLVSEKTLCVFISQSGETADTLAALRIAKKYGAKNISVVNVKGSAIAVESENVIYTEAGREVAVATTKAYSAQLVSLYALAVFLGGIRGTLDGEKCRKLVDELLLLPEKIKETLNSAADRMKELSAKIYREKNIFFIGRLTDYAIAAEGSLKMKEISYLNSQAYPAGELKHGTISLIENGTPVVAIAGKNKVFSKTVSNICEVRARGARVILITDESEKDCAVSVRDTVSVPETQTEFQGSLFVLPLQLLSYYTAKLLGCDIDKPKNLAKSVTVE